MCFLGFYIKRKSFKNYIFGRKFQNGTGWYAFSRGKILVFFGQISSFLPYSRKYFMPKIFKLLEYSVENFKIWVQGVI